MAWVGKKEVIGIQVLSRGCTLRCQKNIRLSCSFISVGNLRPLLLTPLAASGPRCSSPDHQPAGPSHPIYRWSAHSSAGILIAERGERKKPKARERGLMEKRNRLTMSPKRVSTYVRIPGDRSDLPEDFKGIHGKTNSQTWPDPPCFRFHQTADSAVGAELDLSRWVQTLPGVKLLLLTRTTNGRVLCWATPIYINGKVGKRVSEPRYEVCRDWRRNCRSVMRRAGTYVQNCAWSH